MRSSASTRSPPRERPIRCLVRVVGNDHPRACTGRRLLRLGLAHTPGASAAGTSRPIVLDPYAADPLTRADAARACESGILAVDCSWNQLSAGGRFPGDPGPHRRIPFLVATNPQHYGRLGELNTAEALGAALYLLGRPGEAFQLLEGFAGGSAFIDLNRDRLERFAHAASPEEARALERSLYGGTG
jgi:pre-rRNA-processing protein TSR3